MISPNAFPLPTSIVSNIGPATENDALTQRPAPGEHQNGTRTTTHTRHAQTQPPESGLTRFLSRPSVEQILNQALEPEIGVSMLCDPATFDAVLRRSRDAIRTKANESGTVHSLFQAALRVLDHNVVLRSQSRATRNALYQG